MRVKYYGSYLPDARIVTQFASWFIEVQKMADDLNDTHLQRSTQTV